MLKISDISFAYGEVKTLHNIDMQMMPGTVTCITGRNGVGKTTLLGNIMGTLQTKSGAIELQGENITLLAGNKRARKGIALVPQGRHIFPRLSVEENLKIGLEARVDRSREIPQFIYDLFPVLKDMGARMGGDLSGGQQQQLAIGRALAGDPLALLLDEPTEGIQPNIIQQIGEVLVDLAKNRNLIVVIVEQYLDFIREIGDNFYLMNRGRVVADGEITTLTDELVTEYLHV